LGVANHSTPPESTTYPTLIVGAIDLVPSCGSPRPDCAGSAVPGDFSLSTTGTGVSGPPSCLGTWTITGTSPGVFRFRPPGGENTLALSAGAVCLIDFSATALRLPAPGPKTAQVASATFSAPGLGAVRISGYDETTVGSGPPPPPSSSVALLAGHSAKVMHAPAAVGAQVVQWTWTGAAYQRWVLVPLGGDIHAIVSVGSGQALTVAGASPNDGAPLVQSTWTGVVSQWWRAIPFGADAYVLVSVLSGKVVDVFGASTADGAPLVQWPWRGGANQVWFKINL
jgi:hypothetical protein